MAVVFLFEFEEGVFFDGVGIEDDFFGRVVFVNEDEAAEVAGAGGGIFDS